jgi:hypothetical protein
MAAAVHTRVPVRSRPAPSRSNVATRAAAPPIACMARSAIRPSRESAAPQPALASANSPRPAAPTVRVPERRRSHSAAGSAIASASV